jgi:purine catabolism regulator
LTVSALWALAMPALTRLAGGAAGLQRAVEWVTSLRAAYPLFAGLDRGYLAICTPDLGRRVDPQFSVTRLVRELAAAEASGLVVNEMVAPGDAHLADDLGLPVLVVPADTDLRALERDALRALVDGEGQRWRRLAGLRERVDSLLATGGLSAVLRDLAIVTDGQVMLEDGRGCLVAADGADGAAPAEATDDLVAPVSAAGRRLGRLVARGAGLGRGPGLDAYVRAAADGCGLEMLRREARREAEDRLAADIVADLMSADGDDALLRGRLERLGLVVAADRRYMALAVEGADTASSLAMARALAREIGALGARSDLRALVGCHDTVGVCLVSCLRSVGARLPRAWLTAASERQAPLAMCIGVGRAAEDWRGLREAASQALAARSLGRRLGEAASIHYWEDLGLERLLAGLSDQSELRRFYDETIGPLALYDRAHNTDLVATLRAFFEQNTNATQTARALCVHRNTLDYRLQRISDITGLDVDDPDARLTLQLAIKVRLIAPPAPGCATRTRG